MIGMMVVNGCHMNSRISCFSASPETHHSQDSDGAPEWFGVAGGRCAGWKISWRGGCWDVPSFTTTPDDWILSHVFTRGSLRMNLHFALLYTCFSLTRLITFPCSQHSGEVWRSINSLTADFICQWWQAKNRAPRMWQHVKPCGCIPSGQGASNFDIPLGGRSVLGEVHCLAATFPRAHT